MIKNFIDKLADKYEWLESLILELKIVKDNIESVRPIEDLQQRTLDEKNAEMLSLIKRIEELKAIEIQIREEFIESKVKERLANLLSVVNPDKIVMLDKQKGLVYIGGIRVEEGRLASLKAEAEYFANSELWALISETPKRLAEQAMFVAGDSIDDMKKGRSILYTLSAQSNIIDVFRNYNQK